MKNNSGFSFIEIVFVIALGAIIVTFLALSFTRMNRSQALASTATLVASTINEARVRTLSGRENSRYGIHLNGDSLVLFKGETFVATSTNNIVTPLHNLVMIRNVSLTGAGENIIFNKLTGFTSQTGTFELYLKDDPAQFRTISIKSTGIVEAN